MTLGNIYREAWSGQFGLGRGWIPNWWPGTPIALGTRGVATSEGLRYQGTASDIGVDVRPGRAENFSGSWEFSSSRDIEASFGVDATVPGWEWLGNAQAGLSLSFSRGLGMYISAGPMGVERAADVDELSAALLLAAKGGRVAPGQSLVVEVQSTSNAVILASNGGGGEFKAFVNAELGESGALGSVASCAGRLNVHRQSGSLTKQEYPNRVVIAYRVLTLGTRGWWWWREIAVRSAPDGPLSAHAESVALSDVDYFVQF